MVVHGYGAVAIAPMAGGSEESTSELRDMLAAVGLSCGVMSFTGLVFLVRRCGSLVFRQTPRPPYLFAHQPGAAPPPLVCAGLSRNGNGDPADPDARLSGGRCAAREACIVSLRRCCTCGGDDGRLVLSLVAEHPVGRAAAEARPALGYWWGIASRVRLRISPLVRAPSAQHSPTLCLLSLRYHNCNRLSALLGRNGGEEEEEEAEVEWSGGASSGAAARRGGSSFE